MEISYNKRKFLNSVSNTVKFRKKIRLFDFRKEKFRRKFR
ncbi:hypothetical protein J5U23_02138 [Saccharolobus shibatae B12]|uniref:Uncharacterized protein n=1 Tax=Saccharolobus shibatae (strain ATCC 51178 / DSM 5389 / JCM 8931 / NBRC 15437 / B12) TaxID=523848 RepID=A0A8F5BPV4_SACSH|nr:hypothetical protein J5U23_02138 [Saccharolobus shibatae B12]